jgi:hypothetical protein
MNFPASISTAIAKPRKITVPLAQGLAWRGGGNLLYLEKYDGEFVKGGLPFGNHVLIAERMKGAGTWYAAHSVASIAGQNVLGEPTRTRWRELCALAPSFPPWIKLAAAGNGGEFLQAVLDNGGEGVCAFDLDAPWGEMLACKRLTAFLCVVTAAAGAMQSVAIADAATGQARGRLALLGGKADRCRVGSILKVEAFGLHPSGLLREARVCRDTATSWLVKF